RIPDTGISADRRWEHARHVYVCSERDRTAVPERACSRRERRIRLRQLPAWIGGRDQHQPPEQLANGKKAPEALRRAYVEDDGPKDRVAFCPFVDWSGG